MDVKKIQAKLKTSLFGTNIYYEESLDSTNDFAMRLAKDGAPEGTIVLTEYQKSGKGRQNKPWHASRGENLLMSILLRPELEIEMVQKIALATATILIDAIEDFYKNRKIKISELEVKWPNDILLKGKKVGGILAESKLQNKRMEALIIGIGLNVNSTYTEFPEDIRDLAISLKDVIGQETTIEDMCCFFLKRFEQNYTKYERTNYAGVVENWKKHCHQFGEHIIVKQPVIEETGVFHDVSNEGYLVYKTRAGKLKKLIAGFIMRKNKNAAND
ncbi:MAG: biotin--[acetyl-CoA-carboxylase] ligase [Calditrichaceae bacterium]